MAIVKKILNKLYLVAGLIFLIFSLISFVTVKSTGIFIGGLTISILCIAFNFIYKVKWDEEARQSLLDSCEIIKKCGDNLPFSFLGKFQLLWIILLILTFFKPLFVLILPSLPNVVFTIVNNLSFAFFILGTFYQLLEGNLKGISFTTGVFAIYNIIDVVYTFITESQTLSTRSMCLFLVFWSIHLIFSVILSESDPYIEEEKNKKEKKEKKEKKAKKDKKSKASEEKEESKEDVETSTEEVSTQETSE